MFVAHLASPILPMQLCEPPRAVAAETTFVLTYNYINRTYYTLKRINTGSYELSTEITLAVLVVVVVVVIGIARVISLVGVQRGLTVVYMCGKQQAVTVYFASAGRFPSNVKSYFA